MPMPDRLHPVTVTLRRYGAQTRDPVTFLPSDSPTSTPGIVMQEEAWKPDATPPRPEGMTAQTTRLFVARQEVRGALNQASSGNARSDEIQTADDRVWRVREVIHAPRLGPIPEAWHAYCTLIVPENQP